MDLSEKNTIITGAAKRIGRAIALTLAGQGMNIAIHYNNSEKEALGLASTIEKMGRRVVLVKADVTKKREIDSAMDKIYKSLGEAHLLINNAAIFGSSELSKVDDKEWDKYLDTNLKAPFYFAQKFAENSSSEIAKIINIADTYGLSPAADLIPYGVSKGGLIHLTKGLAKALAPKILVNCICPGPILMAGTEAGHYKNAVDATLLKREGTVDDIMKTVLFLSENDYITGQTIFIDGGRTV